MAFNKKRGADWSFYTISIFEIIIGIMAFAGKSVFGTSVYMIPFYLLLPMGVLHFYFGYKTTKDKFIQYSLLLTLIAFVLGFSILFSGARELFKIVSLLILISFILLMLSFRHVKFR